MGGIPQILLYFNTRVQGLAVVVGYFDEVFMACKCAGRSGLLAVLDCQATFYWVYLCFMYTNMGIS
mgnify:CR=1 FL=1